MRRTRLALLLMALFSLGLGSCKANSKAKREDSTQSGGETEPLQARESAGEAKPAGRLRVTVSVDWEGAYISESGLAELAAFRLALPQVPITHWICPAYLVKAEDVRVDLKSELAEAVHKGDEAVLHLHAWASLANAAEVSPKSGPSFLYPDDELVQFEDGDEGFDLELGAYSEQELRAILRKSRELLESTGLRILPMFRGGAGILEDYSLAAIAAEGFLVDTSYIPPKFWRTEHGAPAQMGKRVLELWGEKDDFTDPFWIETSAGKLLEIPSAPGFGDYASVEQFKEYIDQAARRLASDPARDVYVHLGFHQENADVVGDTAEHSFRMRVQLAIEYMQASHSELLVFERMSDVARRYGVRL